MTTPDVIAALAVLDDELAAAGRSCSDGYRVIMGMPHHGDPTELQPYIARSSATSVSTSWCWVSRCPALAYERGSRSTPRRCPSGRTAEPVVG